MLRTGVRWLYGRVRVGNAKFVRLGNVYSIRNYKDCHNVKVFFQGPLMLTFAEKGSTKCYIKAIAP